MSVPWTREVAARFLQKLGFGPTPSQLAQAVTEGRATTTERFLADDTIDTASLENRLASYKFDFTTLDDTNYNLIVGLQRWWYLRMIDSPRQHARASADRGMEICTERSKSAKALAVPRFEFSIPQPRVVSSGFFYLHAFGDDLAQHWP